VKGLDAPLFRELIIAIRPQRRTTMTLAGDSMLPAMRPGDVLLVDPPRGRPHVGDVVVFPHAGVVVAHRVIEREKTRLICAGDASSHRKENVPVEDVIGVVRRVRRENGAVIERPSSAVRALVVRARVAARYYARALRTAGRARG
jgi:phage repressor protein C with HTH and peptisase S24 domain